ncbi:DUF6677 family protein [Trichlorobacter ammonificans]|uniref:DUF5683 domain-containing protein n=1 Tax=Trichlorobacter ammonificans TaxID=2916410 RepID=A0ABM9D7E0_9BACT|nr:DUF6677 family protein [Trichlorobacter ammonificans]CAH2030306.1 conserved membrane protein of unknown function [Trichlorobacter ammonificans]
MKRPLIALLLSAFVLPGLGQLYLGRKLKGALLLVAVNLLLLAALFLAMKLSAPLIGARLAGTPITPELLLAQIQPHAVWGKALLASFLGVWGFAVVDLVSAFRESGRENDI